ncbi:MAG: DNA mismatch repair protein MutS [Schleiferiaceae bacterium]|nr:DNA mismatch repair protein MutS [Schleiferiaceae bacterium]MDR9441930.1 DNA mismatch repair protein MutS [Schleiferiaceae bacterium]
MAKAKADKTTPLMRQYEEIKQKHPGALLLFRVGDFYEMFGEDAVAASRILGIVLTKRANGSASEVELAGFPHHALDAYLPKLVRAGQRVAICDQLEDPKQAKKLVKRGITELVTPGVTTHDQVLQAGKNNFLCAVHLTTGQQGIAFCDISTGELFAAQGSHEYLEKLIQSFGPSEILYSKARRDTFEELFRGNNYAFPLDEWIFKEQFARQNLLDHFKVTSLKGFGIEDLPEAVTACGAIFHYLKETQHHQLDHITSISRIDHQEYVWMDRFTIRNLELFAPSAPDGEALLDVINRTQSPMGARLLQRWLAMPLLDKAAIEKRQAIVQAWYERPEASENAAELLREIYDLERIATKLSTRKISPKELLQLKKGLALTNQLRELAQEEGGVLDQWSQEVAPLLDLLALITDTLQEEPASQVAKGEVIRSGISQELDELRQLLHSGKDKLIEIQQREAQRTGISNLKVAFNNVFGYYLEVRNTHKNKVPPEWVRKQTLVSAERYITEELKEYEQKIMGAEERILVLEQQLYDELIDKASQYLGPIQANARKLAFLDVLLGWALLARGANYNAPTLRDDHELRIHAGRHPVIEHNLPPGEEFIANDVELDREAQQIMMITGPNMSGKSALLRQTALICLMAQLGCFVPATEAQVGLIDKIFVRVGASDNISQGESTFMVEMNETASILNNLSERSLVILDEIGRGTSTYDGVSIAWSIAEFIHQHPSQAKTLFATHYHELNDMAQQFERIRNFNVSVKDVDGKIIFMRKLVEGGSNHSFGIHVAKMAGMPSLVINRADRLLQELEKQHQENPEKQARPAQAEGDMQLSFFQLDDPLLEEIRQDIQNLDVDTLTPVEALMKLNEIKKKIGA